MVLWLNSNSVTIMSARSEKLLRLLHPYSSLLCITKQTTLSLISDTMNVSPKYIIAIVLSAVTIVSLNAFLAVRDSKIIEKLDQRTEMLKKYECELNNNNNCWFILLIFSSSGLGGMTFHPFQVESTIFRVLPLVVARDLGPDRDQTSSLGGISVKWPRSGLWTIVTDPR